MIKRDEQAAIPFKDSSGVVAQREIMIFKQSEGIECDCAERGYDWRIDQFDLPSQERRTVADLRSSRPVIGAAWLSWTAQDAVGNEYLVS